MTKRVDLPVVCFSLMLLAWCAAPLSCIERAHASPEETSKARALFRKARALMQEGDFKPACPLLSESLAIEPGLGTRFNLAHCWEHQGRAASAHALFMEVASAAKSSGQLERAHVARRRALALESSISHVTINVTEQLPGMIVTLDGTSLSNRSWGVPIPVDAGEHELTAEAEGYAAFSAVIYIRPDALTTELTIPLLKPRRQAPPLHDPSEPQVENEAAVPEFKGQASWMQWTLIASATVAATGAALGVTASLNANAVRQQAHRICPDSMRGCEAWELRAFEQRRDEFETWRARSLIGFGAAAVGAVAFATLLWLDEPVAEAPRVSVGLAGDGLKTQLELRF